MGYYAVDDTGKEIIYCPGPTEARDNFAAPWLHARKPLVYLS